MNNGYLSLTINQKITGKGNYIYHYGPRPDDRPLMGRIIVCHTGIYGHEKADYSTHYKTNYREPSEPDYDAITISELCQASYKLK